MRDVQVQIIGCGGMLGREVIRVAKSGGYSVVQDQIDITQVTSSDIKCPLVINCAAITDRKAPGCKVIAVNAIGPHTLAQACNYAGARLIHVSTDMIFSRSGPHVEEDVPDCIGPNSGGLLFPALSKLFGEVSYAPHLTIRMSIVGISSRGLVRDIQNATRESPVVASDRLLWNGVTATYAAGLLLDLAQRKDVSGILHVPGQHTTRWRLCVTIANWLGVPEDRLRRDDSMMVDRRLESSRWRSLGLPDIPGIREQLEALERPHGTY